MFEVETGGTQETEQATGLDAIISSAMEKSGYGDETVVEPVVAPAVAAPEKAEPITDADGRVRTPDGKFASTKPAEAAAPDAAAQATAIPTTPTAPGTAPVVQQVALPEAWTDEWKAKAATLPPDQQQLLVDQYKAMQGDYTRKSQATAETQKQLEPITGEIQRLTPLLQHMRMTPQQFIAESGAVASNLLSGNPKDRAGAIAYLVQHRQVPIAELLTALGVPTPQAGPDGQMTVDPTTTQLRQELSDLKRSFQQLGQQEQVRQSQQAEAEFNAIGSTKDEKGAPKFPHFERVRGSMIRLVADNIAANWDEAYSKAVRLDDDLHKQVVEQERTRALAEAEAARQEAVDKAKKATSVKVSSGSPGGAAKVSGLDAHISAAMERSGFGG